MPEEWTEFRTSGLRKDLTLQQVSMLVGETITELLDRGQKEFSVKFESDAITFRWLKGMDEIDLEQFLKQDGYDPERRYASLWRK